MLVKEVEEKKQKCICYSTIRVMIIRKTITITHATIKCHTARME
jgi:hypothetical protein